jgi:hypothetical protein
MNIKAGGATALMNLRDAHYVNGQGESITQSLYFKEGDVLHETLSMSKNSSVLDGVNKVKHTQQKYHKNFQIPADHELIGCPKGIRNVVKERLDANCNSCMACEIFKGCEVSAYRTKENAEKKAVLAAYDADKNNEINIINLLCLPSKEAVTGEAERIGIECVCVTCTLKRQPDFASQKSGLEEEYDKFNLLNGTNHKCHFLPKFHPELNPIERVWCFMKRYCRRHAGTGSLGILGANMIEGL